MGLTTHAVHIGSVDANASIGCKFCYGGHRRGWFCGGSDDAPPQQLRSALTAACNSVARCRRCLVALTRLHCPAPGRGIASVSMWKPMLSLSGQGRGRRRNGCPAMRSARRRHARPRHRAWRWASRMTSGGTVTTGRASHALWTRSRSAASRRADAWPWRMRRTRACGGVGITGRSHFA
jgi:hypothetical protein